MNSEKATTRAVAVALASGPWERNELEQRFGQLLGGGRKQIAGLVERMVVAFPAARRPSVSLLAAWLTSDTCFAKLLASGSADLAQLVVTPPRMWRHPSVPAWELPEFDTPGDLSDWLAISSRQMVALADCANRERKDRYGRHRHYRYRLLPKRWGSPRLIEIPKRRLKAVQRQINRQLLALIPPHRVAHGFCAGRSIATFAAPHTRADWVMRLDLTDFFPTISSRRVAAFFGTLGYPSAVTEILTGLCTNAAPEDAWGTGRSRANDAFDAASRRYRVPHLPQGAPTSPALANLIAYRLDVRLAALAEELGVRYTRYADDLAFSGTDRNARWTKRLAASAAAIALDEGFRVNYHKTRVMSQGASQRLAGMVVNQGLALPRSDYDRLKATLHNCVRHGPQSQNRGSAPDFRAHLEGRVGFVAWLQPDRGAKLRAMFDAIQWP